MNGIILADGNDVKWESPANFQISANNVSQEVLFLRGEQSKQFDRKNHRTQVAFSVSKLWDSADAAESYCLYHASQVSGGGTVVFELENGVIAYLPFSMVVSASSTYKGSTTQTDYQIVGGKMTSDNPDD